MKTIMPKITLGLGLRLGLSLLALTSIGCTVQLISHYDEQTDKAITALQRKTETFFIKLEGLEGQPDCSHEKQKSFYEESKVDVSNIKLRIDASPQNEISASQIALLANSFTTLELLHKKKANKPPGENCLSVDEIEPLRSNFNVSYTAMIKLELAKKRGDSK